MSALLHLLEQDFLVMKALGRIAAFTTLPFLAGCFSFEQSLSVTPGGEVTFTTEIAMMTEMMAMMGEEADSMCAEPDAEMPDTFTVTREEFVRDADSVCRITAVGPIGEFEQMVAGGQVLPTDDAGDGAPVIAFVDEGGGEYTFSVSFASMGEEDGMDAETMAMMAMMAPLLEGRLMLWSVSAPRIISANESEFVTVEGNTVTLALPVADLITEVGGAYELTVRFGL
jgi:hypothetical protein